MAGIRKKDVKIGGYYAIRHTSSSYGKLSLIKIDGESIYGGWNATNLKTGRSIRIKSNTKLRYECVMNPNWVQGNGELKWLTVERFKEVFGHDPA